MDTQAKLREEMVAGFARMEAKFDTKFAAAEAAAAKRNEEFMRWALGVWVISLASFFGAAIALARLGA